MCEKLRSKKKRILCKKDLWGFFCRRHFYAMDFLHSWWISCPAESPVWKNGSTLRARAMKTSLSTPLDWSSDSSFEGVIWCKRNACRKSWAIPVLRHWTGWRFGRVRTWFPSYTNLFSSCLVFVSGDCSTEHGIYRVKDSLIMSWTYIT